MGNKWKKMINCLCLWYLTSTSTSTANAILRGTTAVCILFQAQCATTIYLGSLAKVNNVIITIWLERVPLIGARWVFTTCVALFYIAICILINFSRSVLIVNRKNRKGHSWYWILVVSHTPLVGKQFIWKGSKCVVTDSWLAKIYRLNLVACLNQVHAGQSSQSCTKGMPCYF